MKPTILKISDLKLQPGLGSPTSQDHEVQDRTPPDHESKAPKTSKASMASDDGPYYTRVTEVPTTFAPDLQIYALADDAVQAQQGHSVGQLAGLIQIATAAAGHDEIRNDSPSDDPKSTSNTPAYDQDTSQAEQDSKGPGVASFPTTTSNRKRKRGEDGSAATSPAETASSTAHAALFRRPSTTCKKHTRPPMSCLFSSLELSAEDFLQLQSRAKAYMLDSTHPDRRDTIGQRGRGDSELVKLRLWNCVKDFLDTEGNGERFFGQQISGGEGATRSIFWPTHRFDVYSAVVPLLRRIVTNEKQRKYASETRKGGSAGAPVHTGGTSSRDQPPWQDFQHRESRPDQVFFALHRASLESYNAWRETSKAIHWDIIDAAAGARLSLIELEDLVATVDFHLRKHHRDTIPRSRCRSDCESNVISQVFAASWRKWFDPNDPSLLQRLFILVQGVLDREPAPVEKRVPNVEKNEIASGIDARILLIFRVFYQEGDQILLYHKISQLLAGTLQQLRIFMTERSGKSLEKAKVMALLPDGLKELQCEGEWIEALEKVRAALWMEGELRILIKQL